VSETSASSLTGGHAPSTLEPIFHDAALDEQFARDGYLVMDLLDPATVAELRRGFAEIYQGETEDACHRSNESRDLTYRRTLHTMITAALGPAMDALLIDHHAISTGTLVKWRGPNSQMPVHQDWTMVDETRFRSLSMWVPLCDVDVDNGALAVLPGSHRVLDGMRPNPGRPPSLVDPIGGIEPIDLTSVDMSAGSCIIFDHGLLHGSPPNTLDQPRTAIVMAATPRRATLQHLWRRPEDDVIERFEVADPEFFRHCTPEVRPDHPAIRLVETLPFRPHGDGARQILLSQIGTTDDEPQPQAAQTTSDAPEPPLVDPIAEEPSVAPARPLRLRDRILGLRR
jgi:ectoine hydroxylase-related dioxygenase (phytanoyl-CoA dioxygenase family)